MSKDAEKLAAAMGSRVVRNWVHSTGTSPKSTGFKHDAECQQAAALLRRQAEQIRELRDSMESYLVAWSNEERKPGWCGRVRAARARVDAALSNTKEAE